MLRRDPHNVLPHLAQGSLDVAALQCVSGLLKHPHVSVRHGPTSIPLDLACANAERRAEPPRRKVVGYPQPCAIGEQQRRESTRRYSAPRPSTTSPGGGRRERHRERNRLKPSGREKHARPNQ
jgi:hypothetical protein